MYASLTLSYAPEYNLCMKTNLDIVREACVKANPQIMEMAFGCEVQGIGALGGFMKWRYAGKLSASGMEAWSLISQTGSKENAEKVIGNDELKYEILGRPIRLADVIHTIMCNHESDNIRLFSDIGEVEFDDGLRKKTAKWNLLKDDLRNQSEPTLSFLVGLLK